LLELVVLQFGDRVLPEEWNGVTEAKNPFDEVEQEELSNGKGH
jgi:hypothetical protein